MIFLALNPHGSSPLTAEPLAPLVSKERHLNRHWSSAALTDVGRQRAEASGSPNMGTFLQGNREGIRAWDARLCLWMQLCPNIEIPVVPHKAVAEVSE